MAPTFEIHIEDWHHALHIDSRGHTSHLCLFWLLDALKKYDVCPEVYLLEDYSYENPAVNQLLRFYGLKAKSHGVHHYYDEKADRSPYFNQEGQPGLCGGFFFRLLPTWFLRMEIKRTGLFYIHPHDLDVNHPKLKNPFLNWKRHVGLKGARKKLESLLASGIFRD